MKHSLASILIASALFSTAIFCRADDDFLPSGLDDTPEELVADIAGHIGPSPADSILLEAEDMTFDKASWSIRKRVDEWNRLSGAPSGGLLLDGSASGAGKAVGVMKIERAGEYRLHVRYVDNNDVKDRESLSFKARVFQGGRCIGEKVFDSKHISRQHDRYFKVDPVWDYVDVKAAAGKIEIEITKTAPATASVREFGRNIDCFVLTASKAYKPHIFDFHPVYVRVTSMRKQTRPFRFMFCGVPLVKGRTPVRGSDLFQPGDKSEFLYVSERIKESIKGGLTVGIPYNPYARGDVRWNSYIVEFSTSPDEKGVFAKLVHDENGLSFPLFLDPASRKLKTDIDWSLVSLENAESVKDVSGAVPRHYPLYGGIVMNDETYHTEAIENEVKAQKRLGLALTREMSAMSPALAERYSFTRPFHTAEFIFDAHHGCLCSPDAAKMEQILAKRFDAMKKNGTFEKCDVLGIMDEPALGVSAIMECRSTEKNCHARFIEYLAANGVKPSDLGLSALSEAKLSRDPKDGGLFYWSVRYRNNVLAVYARTVTDVVKRLAPHMRTTFNIATELVSNGSMIQFGADWFLLFNSGALTAGETEDWSNLSPTYEVCGYIMDVMRGACRREKVPFSMLNVLGGRSSPEIAAKAFSEIGRGASAITFFRYGPSYTGASDSVSHVRSAHEGMARVAYSLGAVETESGSPYSVPPTFRGDAAMLLSVTGDIYQILNFANPYGRERMWLHLLLSHLSVRLDVISEEDLTSELANYKHLFVCDRNIRREYYPVIEDWVKSGGTLIMTSGALERDEFDRPVTFAADSPLRREEAQVTVKKIHDKDNVFGSIDSLELANSRQQFTGGDVFLKDASSHNAASCVKYGKGRIVFIGFMPGLSYIRSSRDAAGKQYHSDIEYPDTGRKLMSQILESASLSPRVKVAGAFAVEALCTENSSGELILTLANWTRETPDVSIAVKDAPPCTKAQIFQNDGKSSVSCKYDAKSRTLTVDIKSLPQGGACVRLSK